MRSYFISLSLLALAICLALSACDKSVKYQPVDPQADLKKQISHSPRPDEEAEHMALWLGGEVVAHDTLYEKLKNATALVRNTFRDTVPYLDSMGFIPVYCDNYLDLLLTTDAVDRVREGTYREWDSLNRLFRTTSVDTLFDVAVFHYNWATLRFDVRLNPIVLGSLYVKLEGVESTGIWAWTMPDHGNLFPRITDDGVTFLLRQSWGDCYLGCISSHYWYFRVKDSGAEYVGDYLADHSSEPPDWWEEASVVIHAWWAVRPPN
jgi:hypothetical protein